MQTPPWAGNWVATTALLFSYAHPALPSSGQTAFFSFPTMTPTRTAAAQLYRTFGETPAVADSQPVNSDKGMEGAMEAGEKLDDIFEQMAEHEQQQSQAIEAAVESVGTDTLDAESVLQLSMIGRKLRAAMPISHSAHHIRAAAPVTQAQPQRPQPSHQPRAAALPASQPSHAALSDEDLVTGVVDTVATETLAVMQRMERLHERMEAELEELEYVHTLDVTNENGPGVTRVTQTVRSMIMTITTWSYTHVMQAISPLLPHHAAGASSSSRTVVALPDFEYDTYSPEHVYETATVSDATVSESTEIETQTEEDRFLEVMTAAYSETAGEPNEPLVSRSNKLQGAAKTVSAGRAAVQAVQHAIKPAAQRVVVWGKQRLVPFATVKLFEVSAFRHTHTHTHTFTYTYTHTHTQS